MAWVFLTRSGSEKDLIEEIGENAELLSEGVVMSPIRRRRPDATYAELAFARQAMEVHTVLQEGGPEEIADAVHQAMNDALPPRGEPWRWALQIVSADGRDPHDPRRGLTDALQATIPEALRIRLSPALRAKEHAVDEAQRLVQVWVAEEDAVAVGTTLVTEALSIWPAGKPRLRRPEDAVSRSGLKLEEAIIWLGIGPEKGDRCVDLGAAPGGWTQVAVGRGAYVLAIDPARMKVDFPPKRYAHLQESAFEYAPEETFDWLLCDMAWRPREVAQLLAKWGRRGWARQVIVNFKLPMKKKAAMMQEVETILVDAGWQGLRKRQLFHDRDEVTVVAWLDPRIVARGAQPAFQMRNQAKRGPGGRDGRPRGSGKTAARATSPRGRGRSGPRAGGRGRRKPR